MQWKVGMMACRYCVLEKGIIAGDFFKTQEELIEHIEMVHDMPIRGPGESHTDATARVKKKNPRLGGPSCQCPACKGKRQLKAMFFDPRRLN